MTEAEWLTSNDPIRLLEFVDLASRRKARLLGCAMCRQVWHEVRDERCRNELRAAEQLADGRASQSFVETATFEAETAYEEALGSERSEVLAVYAAISLTVGDIDAVDIEAICRATADLAPFGQNVRLVQADLIREVLGNPFRSPAFNSDWRTTDVKLLAEGTYAANAFQRLPILADALQDAGRDSEDLLNHLRDTSATHVRGCWALDLVLGKE